jgi:hypothetical protein
MAKQQDILSKVNRYYTDKVREHGATPAGVDWNSAASQELRFEQLLKVVQDPKANFSLMDYGCGFGSMYEFMRTRYNDFHFTGFDISEEMIAQAETLYPADAHHNWITALPAEKKWDYVVSSGIFNVRQDETDTDWQAYILQTLHEMNERSEKGFAFNSLTSYSDAEYMRDYLYYADPKELFDYCKKHFSKQVALLHDYPLYEFSILVKKL